MRKDKFRPGDKIKYIRKLRELGQSLFLYDAKEVGFYNPKNVYTVEKVFKFGGVSIIGDTRERTVSIIVYSDDWFELADRRKLRRKG
jgi:hypothetical protein